MRASMGVQLNHEKMNYVEPLHCQIFDTVKGRLYDWIYKGLYIAL